MKVLYFPTHWSEIVFCEAPVGTAMFWPKEHGLSGGAAKGRWKVLTPVKDGLPPRTRVVCVVEEVAQEKFGDALRGVFARLSSRRKREGVLGVLLKDDPYKVPETGELLYCVGFFHVPAAEAWEEGLSSMNKPPEGFPTRVMDRSRAAL